MQVTLLRKGHHRYRGNGAGVMPTLRAADMNLLRLDGFSSIRQGLRLTHHDIKAMLSAAMRQPLEKPT